MAGQTSNGPVGLTLSSVASVSAEPPVLSFSVTRATGSAGGILSTESFTVNFLAEDQAEIATAFAVTGAERFSAAQGWQNLDTGEPYLPGAVAVIRCKIRSTHAVGPSVLILADVLAVHFGELKNPLIFRDRKFYSGHELKEL